MTKAKYIQLVATLENFYIKDAEVYTTTNGTLDLFNFNELMAVIEQHMSLIIELSGDTTDQLLHYLNKEPGAAESIEELCTRLGLC